MTAERYVLASVLGWIADRWNVGTPGIGLLGIGMGGQGALRFAYKYPDHFPVVAAITPRVDYQICYHDDPALQEMYPDPEAARQDTALLHIHPLNWPRNRESRTNWRR